MLTQTLKDFAQEAVMLVGIGGGCIAAFKAIREMRASNSPVGNPSAPIAMRDGGVEQRGPLGHR